MNDGTAVPYGLGLHLDELGPSQAIFHEGGTASFSSWLAYYPDRALVVTVLSNTLGPQRAGHPRPGSRSDRGGRRPVTVTRATCPGPKPSRRHR